MTCALHSKWPDKPACATTCKNCIAQDAGAGNPAHTHGVAMCEKPSGVASDTFSETATRIRVCDRLADAIAA